MQRLIRLVWEILQIPPLKKIPETNAIFEQLAAANKRAHASEEVLRISMDAKAVVKMWELSRDGRTRAPTVALDHDFKGTMVTPMGMFLPQHDELYVYMVTRATSDKPSRLPGRFMAQHQAQVPLGEDSWHQY